MCNAGNYIYYVQGGLSHAIIKVLVRFNHNKNRLKWLAGFCFAPCRVYVGRAAVINLF